ncbi:hypothetical protein EAF10_08845 [Staphylococcus pseudintermedius]|nr:hypothetical protein [Staphylococcus pseudintermedius]
MTRNIIRTFVLLLTMILSPLNYYKRNFIFLNTMPLIFLQIIAFNIHFRCIMKRIYNNLMLIFKKGDTPYYGTN